MTRYADYDKGYQDGISSMRSKLEVMIDNRTCNNGVQND
jgi:hypothetical protein